MGKVKVGHETETAWMTGARPSVKDGVNRYSHTRMMAVHEGGMRMGRVVYDPWYRTEAHAHAANEIIYILRGDITVGEKTYGPGTAITIEANTIYGPLSAGPEGAEFILIFDGDAKGSFRPHEKAK